MGNIAKTGSKTSFLIIAIGLLTMSFFASACNKASFGTRNGNRSDNGADQDAQSNPKKDPLDISDLDQNKDKEGPIPGDGEVVHRVINLTCNTSAGVDIEMGQIKGDEPSPFGLVADDNLPGEEPMPLPSKARVTATVKGEFCPTAKNALTVLFIVDFSGSMGHHLPTGEKVEVPGNDPQISGSCGRLRAAGKVLEKLAQKNAADKVQVGLVPFAGGIVGSRVIGITDLEQFASEVNKDSFCQYIVQGEKFGYDPQNPGGLDGRKVGKGGILGALGLGAVDSSTNYKAAFQAAQTMLAPVYGRKVVYFISDGEPTSGGTEPIRDGIAEGQKLRATKNLELNALFLGADDQKSYNVLEQIAGPDRTRRADNADQLAAQILNFPDGKIDSKSGQAFLTVDPYPKENLGLQYMREDKGRPGIWIYETQPFVLLGTPGKTVINLVEINAKGTDGTSHQADVRIRYRQ